ncbi:rab9 effector protein with kelch motifs [Selaginella moellendorffii]|uniref:rab9 effector protein with kelch motifs n=1 Tax=Selaginella moellendorffii TaxID=88036 RepID=UPI000D1C516E|nr:rab9 effector protein with kelch motifs [Selaginella moellendorffii]|eukprot:XP_024523563.1 rab9 effector protein with kelch motifs [Selaginella moellendorffii]
MVHFSGYGWDECQTNDVHVFDFGMYTWSKPVIKGTHPSPQDSHSSTAVGSKLYVFGDTNGTSPLDDLFVLDNATNTLGKPDVFGPREGHSASLMVTTCSCLGDVRNPAIPPPCFGHEYFCLEEDFYHWSLAYSSG